MMMNPNGMMGYVPPGMPGRKRSPTAAFGGVPVSANDGYAYNGYSQPPTTADPYGYDGGRPQMCYQQSYTPATSYMPALNPTSAPNPNTLSGSMAPCGPSAYPISAPRSPPTRVCKEEDRIVSKTDMLSPDRSSMSDYSDLDNTFSSKSMSPPDDRDDVYVATKRRKISNTAAQQHSSPEQAVPGTHGNPVVSTVGMENPVMYANAHGYVDQGTGQAYPTMYSSSNLGYYSSQETIAVGNSNSYA